MVTTASRHSTSLYLRSSIVLCSLTISYTTVMAIMGIVQRSISCSAAYNYERRHGSTSVSAISIFRIVACTFSLSLSLSLFLSLSVSLRLSRFHSRRPLFALFAAIVIARESTRTLGRGVTREIDELAQLRMRALC